MENDLKPYIHISVEESIFDDLYVLERIAEKFHKIHKIQPEIVNDEHPILKIEFPSKESMIKAYSRDNIFFEVLLEFITVQGSPDLMLGKKILNLFRNPEISIIIPELIPHLKDKFKPIYEKLVDKKINPLTQSQYVLDGIIPENSVILKYRTNFKEFLRQKYNYFFGTIRPYSPNNEMEEIFDGFLVFYRTVLDFELSLVDLMDKKQIFDCLAKFGLKDSEFWTLLEELYTRIEERQKISNNAV